jgi:hypothetical protein
VFLKRLLGAGLSEVSMGSLKYPHVFDPLDLEIIDRVYEAAWARVEARNPFRNVDSDGERREALRKFVMTPVLLKVRSSSMLSTKE